MGSMGEREVRRQYGGCADDASGAMDRETRQSSPRANLGEMFMLISVINRSRVVTDAQLQTAVRAINRQLEEDFYPHWQFGARLRVDGAGRVAGEHDKKIALPLLPGRRGDAVIYLHDTATIKGAEGYHDKNNIDVPFGFVFLDICKEC